MNIRNVVMLAGIGAAAVVAGFSGYKLYEVYAREKREAEAEKKDADEALAGIELRIEAGGLVSMINMLIGIHYQQILGEEDLKLVEMYNDHSLKGWLDYSTEQMRDAVADLIRIKMILVYAADKGATA